MTNQDLLIDDYKIVRDSIRLVLEDVGLQLKVEGHDYEVTDEIPAIPLTLPYGGIALRVFPKDVNWEDIRKFGAFNKIPMLVFGLNLSERKIEVISDPRCEGNRFTQWQIGRANVYNLNEVTTEVVQDEVHKFLKQIPLNL